MPATKPIAIAEGGNQGGIRVWPSEPIASRIYDIANMVLVASLAFGVISTGLIVWMGNVKEEYLKSRLATGESDLAAAKLELGKQQVRAADADVRVAGLETEAANAGIEMAKQQTRAAIAEKSLLELRAQVAPRRLSGKQKAELAALLAGEGRNGVAIVSPMMDGEASDFADDFKSAVETAHWETLRIVNRISSKFGLAVVTCEGTGEPVLALAKRLDDALNSVGIAHEVTTFKNEDASTSPPFQTGYLYLVVEHKPLPNAKANELQ